MKICGENFMQLAQKWLSISREGNINFLFKFCDFGFVLSYGWNVSSHV